MAVSEETLIMAAAWFFGAFVNGLTGMGGMLIALPLLTLFVVSKSAIVISLFPGFAAGFLTLLVFGRFIHFREALEFWIAALPGMVLGVLTLKLVDMEVLQIILAAIITTHVAIQLVQDWLGTCMAPHISLRLILGFAAGFFTGSIGINGPIMAIYASLMCMDENSARGFFTSAVPIGIVNIALVAAGGLVSMDTLAAEAIVLPATVAGFLCALPFAKKIRKTAFHAALLLLLCVTAMTLFYRSAPYVKNLLFS